jgi:hypothetical protein
MARGACPVVQRKFQKSVNMTPSAIRAWARDPRAKCASFESTRKRLPALAKLKAKKGAWTEADCKYAQRVVNFNTRMQGNVNTHGCKVRNVTSLLNWGRKPPKCSMPPKGCSTRKPRTAKPKRGAGDR